MVKTVTLTGTELAVTDLGGQNAAVKNLSDGSIYASLYPNVVAGADNVVEIPAGGGEVVLDANGTVYLLGTGKVQCTGTPYATPNFKMPSSSTSGGGGGSVSGVVCGVFERIETDKIQSIPISTDGSYDDINKKFAATLAIETGWELQSDDITVLKDGKIGFCFAAISSTPYVYLANAAHGRLDKFQYLHKNETQYCLDIYKTTSDTVTFGFRPNSDAVNLTFILSKNGAGENVAIATFNGTAGIEYITEQSTSWTSITKSWFSRINSIGENVVFLHAFPDIALGGVFNDVYIVRTDPTTSGVTNWNTGEQIKVNGKRFVIVRNAKYSGDPVIAMPLD